MRGAFEVRAPRDAVFSFFADLNRPWTYLAPTFQVVVDGPVRQGATFRLSAPNARDDMDGVVEIHDPPSRLVLRVWPRLHPDRIGMAGYEFEATDIGTRVSGYAETRMSPLLQLAALVVRPFIWLEARRGMKRLVPIIEAEYRAGRLTADDSPSG
jgi:hypothetical protein